MKKGFTLIELLSVIVILSVILIISIPKIQNVIYESKKESFRDAAKLVASSIEKKYQSDLPFGSTFNLGTIDNKIDCLDIISLDSDEYKSCTYYFDENERVIIDLIATETGRFAGLKAYGSVSTMNIFENSYLVKINNNNGTGEKSIVVNYNTIMPNIEVPTKEGYIFAGYYSLENGQGTRYYNSLGENEVVFTSATNLYAYFVLSTYLFDYKGSEDTFTVPVSGTYKLETWGAQGGYNNELTALNYGAYSVGNVSLNKNTILYINVGGKGSKFANGTNTSSGGYNGGGTGGFGNQGGSGGGGATHIATISGVLSTLSSNISNILIVSGGGGGSASEAVVYAGAGGGYIGNNGGYTTTYPTYYSTGATQSMGGKDNAEGKTYEGFGSGGNYIVATYGGNGGGGGFYGGGGSSRGHSGAGGGSGYIGNTLLTDKAMYCYNCNESNEISTKTISTTCTNADPVVNCSKKGNGYVKITLISIN